MVAAAFGVVGFVIALLALGDAAHGYEAFLLVVVYWIGPWLGVVLTDQYLRRAGAGRAALRPRLPQPGGRGRAARRASWCRCGLFSNQELFVGLVPRVVPGVGDVTFLVGIALAAGVYALLFRRQATVQGERVAVADGCRAE